MVLTSSYICIFCVTLNNLSRKHKNVEFNQFKLWPCGAMVNAFPLRVGGLGFDSCLVRLFFFFFVVVLFCFISFFFFTKHIGSVL